METKEYFEKVMQNYNQHGKGRSLRKYCKDEAIDYNWLIAYKKTYPGGNDKCNAENSGPIFVPLSIAEEKTMPAGWQVTNLVLQSPCGDLIEIKSSNLFVVAELLRKMS